MTTEALRFIANGIRGCTKCPLSETRTQAVPGIGSPDAPIMFVARSPGFAEDKTGIPMAGKAGVIFDQVLDSVGLTRRLFFITNVIKCMPPKGHRLTVGELEACEPWLRSQQRIVSPKLLVLAGAEAVSSYFPGERIGDIHGLPSRRWEHTLLPVYHPAAAIHNEDLRPVLLRDFEVVARLAEDYL